MKYEVTQQGFVDFFNTLTYTQQDNLTNPSHAAGSAVFSGGGGFRNGVRIQTPGGASTTPAVSACNLNGNTIYGEATDGKDIACNEMSWNAFTAYLDWSGLRPMTELEYEKACRGTAAPVPNNTPGAPRPSQSALTPWPMPGPPTKELPPTIAPRQAMQPI